MLVSFLSPILYSRIVLTDLVHGFHVAGRDFAERSERAWLQSEDPWEVLVGCHVACRRHRRPRLERLHALLRASDDPRLSRAVHQLVACAWPWRSVRAFLGESRDPASSILALGLSCRLGAVGELALHHAVATDMREDVEAELERLLGPLPKPEQAVVTTTTGETLIAVDRIAYLLAVRTRAEEVESACGESAVYEGAPFDVSRLARAIVERATHEQRVVPAEILLFEASTGVDCSSFVHEGAPRVDAVRSVVEAFLASSERASFVAGRRYFWGLPIAKRKGE
ncbi:MAG: hypothetical protein QOI41_3723 [Myxococcales bacterium]|nr:hypothetical protein [Myxococcales bacterium]